MAKRVNARIPLSLLLALVMALAVPATAHARTLVYIDAGHGGPYNHVSSHGLREKTLNLQIARELRSALAADGFGTGMTRNADVSVGSKDRPTWHFSSHTRLWSYYADHRVYRDPPIDDLQARCDLANAAGADLFVSIHNNAASSSSARGTEVFSSDDDSLAHSLAACVDRALVAQTGLKNRGAKRENFYVLRWTNMPAVLIEGGFITNRYDARLLASASFRRKVGRGIATGIEKWLATKPFKRRYPRLGGATAADVAAAASHDVSTPGTGTVLLVSSADATSAMTVAPLSRALRAPVLVAEPGGLPTATVEALGRLRPSRIIAIAPADALSDGQLADAASAAGDACETERIAGDDVYATAALVAERVGVAEGGTVTLVPASSFADALTASCIANGAPGPILLTGPGGELPPATAAFLTAHAASISRVRAVAGAAASAPTALRLASASAQIVSDTDRYRRNATVLRTLWKSGSMSPVVTASAPSVTGIVAASVAARNGRPLVLTGGRVLSPYTREWMSNVHARVRSWTLVGTDAELPNLLDALIAKSAR